MKRTHIYLESYKHMAEAAASERWTQMQALQEELHHQEMGCHSQLRTVQGTVQQLELDLYQVSWHAD